MLEQPLKLQLVSSPSIQPLLMGKSSLGERVGIYLPVELVHLPRWARIEGRWCWWHITHEREEEKTGFRTEVWKGRRCRSRGILCLSSPPSLSERQGGKRCSCHYTIHLGTSKRRPDVPHHGAHMHHLPPNPAPAPKRTHINAETAGENITHLTSNSHCTWHIPPILVCSLITLATAAVARSHIICSFLPCCLLKNRVRFSSGWARTSTATISVKPEASSHTAGGCNLLF